MSHPESVPQAAGGPGRRSAWLAVRVLLVRLRFFLLLAGVLLIVGTWPTLRAYWERFTRRTTGAEEVVSLNMEYWCPMCPGVVSEWPSKCPVCNMVLVRRQKNEATPLPDGVVARMQFSPYRVQLAGIRTAAVEYRPLRREVVLVGIITKSESASVSVEAEVFEKDLPFLTEGRAVEAASDTLPGHLPFTGEIAAVETNALPGSRSFRVQLRIDDPERELRRGTLLTSRLEVPIMRLPWWRRAATEEWCNRAAVEAAARSLLPGVGLIGPSGVESLLHHAVVEAIHTQCMGLAVPHSAVVDHGSRKLAFVENGPGMFDAVEITVGPRCGDYYPVLRGVENGQRVAVAGAFLLDAEMWLNHGVAASYFGATRGASTAPQRGTPPQRVPPAAPSTPHDHNTLSPEDRILAARQKVCPVTDEPLDSMGGPVRVEVAGRVVFICCKGCEAPLRKNPVKYLTKLPTK